MCDGFLRGAKFGEYIDYHYKNRGSDARWGLKFALADKVNVLVFSWEGTNDRNKIPRIRKSRKKKLLR